MIGYVTRRLAACVPTLFVVVTLSFFLIRLAPGGPFDLERPLDPQVLANLRRIYQLDQPLIVQYGNYLASLLHGDFGPSFSVRDFTVAELLGHGLPVSILLGTLALVLSFGLGVLLGTLAALRQNRTMDHAVMVGATLGLTIPNFVIGPLLQILLALTLHWLPVAGFDNGNIRNLIMPVIVLALPQIAVVARLTRASMIEALRANHIRTLRAYGLSQTGVALHALRGALLPVVSYLGPAAASLLTGSLVVETVFGLPGIGRYFVDAALNRDYTLVMGTVVLIAVFVLVFNLVVDILYALLDPRVQES